MESKIARRVPVFVFPTILNYYLNSRQSHKQLLTLYNPYDFPVRFQVLSTAPNKYTVIDPEGSIGPQCCVDIVIRHILPSATNCNVVDKFRITMLDHSTKQVLGKRDIVAKLSNTEPDNVSTDSQENFQPLSTLPMEQTKADKPKRMQHHIQNLNRSHPTNYVAVVTGLICIFALLLPTENDALKKTNIPSYLHLSMNLKLIFSFVLGLVSMAILKP